MSWRRRFLSLRPGDGTTSAIRPFFPRFFALQLAPGPAVAQTDDMTCGSCTMSWSSPQRATLSFDVEIDGWIPEQIDLPETYAFARGRSASRAVFTGSMNSGCVSCNRSLNGTSSSSAV
jgi:hypothetical protein